MTLTNFFVTLADDRGQVTFTLILSLQQKSVYYLAIIINNFNVFVSSSIKQTLCITLPTELLFVSGKRVLMVEHRHIVSTLTNKDLH